MRSGIRANRVFAPDDEGTTDWAAEGEHSCSSTWHHHC